MIPSTVKLASLAVSNNWRGFVRASVAHTIAITSITTVGSVMVLCQPVSPITFASACGPKEHSRAKTARYGTGEVKYSMHPFIPIVSRRRSQASREDINICLVRIIRYPKDIPVSPSCCMSPNVDLDDDDDSVSFSLSLVRAALSCASRAVCARIRVTHSSFRPAPPSCANGPASALASSARLSSSSTCALIGLIDRA